jgi:hypothetical protein
LDRAGARKKKGQYIIKQAEKPRSEFEQKRKIQKQTTDFHRINLISYIKTANPPKKQPRFPIQWQFWCKSLLSFIHQHIHGEFTCRHSKRRIRQRKPSTKQKLAKSKLDLALSAGSSFAPAVNCN